MGPRSAWFVLPPLLLISACHDTFELPVPPGEGPGTFVFVVQGADASFALSADTDEEGRLSASALPIPADASVHALRFDCPRAQLGFDGRGMEVLNSPRNQALQPNASYILDGERSSWQPAAFGPLEGLERSIDWEAPTICEARYGSIDYSRPFVPPNKLVDLAGMILLNDEEALIASSEGPAFVMNREGAIRDVTLPGRTRSIYRGRDDLFFVLNAEGEIYEGNSDFVFRKLAEGAPIGLPNEKTGYYEANQLTGTDDGREFAVINLGGASVRQPLGNWRVVAGLGSDRQFFSMQREGSGSYLVFGTLNDLRVRRVDSGGRELKIWDDPQLGEPIRFSNLQGVLRLTTSTGLFELENDSWRPLFISGNTLIPVGEAPDDGLLLAGPIGVTRRVFTAGFGLFHADKLCVEEQIEDDSDGFYLETLVFDAQTQLLATRRLTAGETSQVPILSLRRVDYRQRKCGVETL